MSKLNMLNYNYDFPVVKVEKSKPGLVLVSTGARKLRKPSVVGHYVKSSILKINANDNLAYAA